MATFYAPKILLDQKEYLLSEEESKHCVRVLRYNLGSQINLIDGKGKQFKAIVVDNHPKRCKLQINEVIFHQKPQKQVHIALAPTKHIDRIEWFVEKAVELGLTKLTFLQCENNERSTINLDRIQKIAVAALKQSKRHYLPEIDDFVSFINFVQNNPNGYIGHCYDGAKIKLNELGSAGPFLIGPEGDFSRNEVEFAISHGYEAVHMNEFRLRTETAALTAVFSLNYLV
jgi:16S rRNA (uracil1498-N3)-methyltransferase